MPRSQVTSGFFRIQMLVTLGLSVLATLSFVQFTPETEAPLLPPALARVLCGVLAGISFLGSVMWTLERRQAGSALAIATAVLSAGVLAGSSLTTASVGTAAGWLLVLSEYSTAALLGAAMTGMLLGHWYLTAPTMSIAPLSTLNAFLGAAVLSRLILSAIGLALVWALLGDTTHLTWLGLRWIGGILGPIAVVLMVWRILRYRNTQAATGVLFVGVILTILGELTAALLYQELRIPV